MAMNRLMIDAQSGRPAYQQIADQVVAGIRAGSIAVGERLPAIRRLADELGMHRDTVALAYEQLAGEGWVEAQVGRGTFVLEPPVGADLAGVGPSVGDEKTTERAGILASQRRPRGSKGDSLGGDDVELAPQVEQLISLDNTRPRYATGEDVIALHKLIPDPRFYPIDAFRRCIDQAVAEDGPALFSYAPPEGDPRLRRALSRMNRIASVFWKGQTEGEFYAEECDALLRRKGLAFERRVIAASLPLSFYDSRGADPMVIDFTIQTKTAPLSAPIQDALLRAIEAAAEPIDGRPALAHPVDLFVIEAE